MFGFFRRKKPVPVSDVAPAPEVASAAGLPDADAPAAVPADRSGLVVAADQVDPANQVVAEPAAERIAERIAEPAAGQPASGAADAAPADIPAAAPAAPDEAATAAPRAGWLTRLKQGLSKTRGNLSGLFSGVRIDETLYEELETALLVSDAGVETTTWLLDTLRETVRRERIEDPEGVRRALRSLLADLLRPLERPIDIDAATPLVMMIAGVNGAGKTTSIGKLAHHLQREGKTVLLAAGDTFRAAAREQLQQWGTRNSVQVIAQQGGDPAAVAFDAVNAGRARGTGVVMVDTAGRLPTQLHLMDELKKIHRVIGKAMPGAPHEVLIVLDGNTGQNMLAQVRAFDDAIGVTGLIVTKLDGTAKGGTLAALAHTRRDRPIPVCFIGVGEGIDDLQGFSADEFASALLD